MTHMTDLASLSGGMWLTALAVTVTYLYVFWLVYITVMGLYRAHLTGRLAGPAKWLAYPIVLVGLVMDVMAQYTLATLFFWDWPANGEKLVTTRLQRYVATGKGWRYKKAKALCDGLLDIFDPSGEHC